jgi:HK97 family phage prohead protease
MEKRATLLSQIAPTVAKRADGDAAPTSIVGYGAVYYRSDSPGTEYVIQLWDGWTLRERIMPGAFDVALKSDKDIIAAWNHDTSKPLGRRSRGTLALTSDSTGLRYEITPPNTTWGRDAMESVGRGDVQGSSFAFSMGKDPDVVTTEDPKSKTIVREIRSISRLYEVSPVAIPAYEATASQVRSDDDDAKARIAASVEADWYAEAQKQNDLNLKSKIGITIALANLVK